MYFCTRRIRHRGKKCSTVQLSRADRFHSYRHIYDSRSIHKLSFMKRYITRYKLVKKLGPTNSPIQNTTFPKITLSRIAFDREKATSGI